MAVVLVDGGFGRGEFLKCVNECFGKEIAILLLDPIDIY
jgi:hypothetical protein